MIRNTPIHVKLEVASSALKMAIQRMPSFPGQFGDDIDLRDPGLLATMAPTSNRLCSSARWINTSTSLLKMELASDVDSARVVRMVPGSWCLSAALPANLSAS